MDLENFPTRELAKEMMDMISPIYDKSYVGKWIFEVMAIYLGLASDTIKGLTDEIVPQTATWTLPYWEQAYGIETDPDLSIEERRAAIIRKRNYRAPMNPARIAMLVSDICGRDVVVVENTLPHTYDVVISGGDSNVVLDSVLDLIYDVRQPQKHVRVIFLDSVGLQIRASPLQKVFDYRMTGEHTITGRWPEPSYIGSKDSAGITVSPDDAEQVFPYPITGTRPDAANIGDITSLQVQGTVSEAEATFPYVIAGTRPDISTIGDLEDGGITASVDEHSASVVYKMCGEDTL